MATVKINEEVVKTIKSIILELSPEEAAIVKYLTGRVSSLSNIRKPNDAIFYALTGIKLPEINGRIPDIDATGLSF